VTATFFFTFYRFFLPFMKEKVININIGERKKWNWTVRSTNLGAIINPTDLEQSGLFLFVFTTPS
jgi:hypothetical protein